MTESQELFNLLIRASQGSRKEGYTATNANVGMTVSTTNDTATFTVVLPIDTAVTATGESIIIAKDWVTLQPLV